MSKNKGKKIIIDIYPFGTSDFWKLVFLPIMLLEIGIIGALFLLSNLL